MVPWQRNKEEPIAADRADLLEAYKEGRTDERTRVARDAGGRIDKADVREVYERGRRDERARHRGSPLATLLVLAVIVAGGAVVYLAASEGSFSKAGATIDSNISTASQKVQAPVRQAADRAGSTLEQAGESLKQR